MRQGPGSLFIIESPYAAGFEPFEQRRNHCIEIRSTGTRNDADTLEGFSGVHVCQRFYPSDFLRACRKYS